MLLFLVDIVINTILGRLTLDRAGMHCPAWDDAFVSSLLYYHFRRHHHCLYNRYCLIIIILLYFITPAFVFFEAVAIAIV